MRQYPLGIAYVTKIKAGKRNEAFNRHRHRFEPGHPEACQLCFNWRSTVPFDHHRIHKGRIMTRIENMRRENDPAAIIGGTNAQLILDRLRKQRQRVGFCGTVVVARPNRQCLPRSLHIPTAKGGASSSQATSERRNSPDLCSIDPAPDTTWSMGGNQIPPTIINLRPTPLPPTPSGRAGVSLQAQLPHPVLQALCFPCAPASA